ncbi:MULTISPECIES: RadC family protein [unclassified Spiroplasma]|uniref:RadC family protein n=1 Tax=unclassified Spiroplasma TaxID=2637901 RepID=UPI00313BA442
MKFKDIPINERPREKAWKNGIKNLSNNELLALLLRTGNKKQNVLQLAQYIINHFNGVENLLKVTLNELTVIKGIGKVKAIELLASFELYQRININIANNKIIRINNPYDIFYLLQYEVSNLNTENFYLILLNNNNRIIFKQLVYQGTINQISIDPKDIYYLVLKNHAQKIICAHNHPNNDSLPSKHDIETTNSLIYIAKVLKIEFVDHIIISKNNFYSILLQTKFAI